MEAYQAWSNVANAIVDFEPITMLVRAQDLEIAREHLDSRVEIELCALDDGWARDIGPTFVKSAAGEVAAIDWVFNGWGAQGSWASWKNDDRVAEHVASLAGVSRIRSSLINEGGGIHVNGSGTVLLTETVQLGEGRNAHLSRAEVEAELHDKLGTNRAIWLRRGLTRDYEEFGTQGHVDIVACFANEHTILYHNQTNPDHPDFSVSHEVRRTLEEVGGFELVPVDAPVVLRDEHGFVDYSYINHYICNGAVILCAFGDVNDAKAKRVLERVYPDRQIVLVDARALFARGGGIHCITQQQPA
jgi:agmatine deiminase